MTLCAPTTHCLVIFIRQSRVNTNILDLSFASWKKTPPTRSPMYVLYTQSLAYIRRKVRKDTSY